MKKIVISISLILFLTSCNTKMSISKDFLISSGKWCGVYYNTQNICNEFSPKDITVYRGKKKKVYSVKYEKINDSLLYIYPLDGGEKNEIYLKSKDTIILNGGEYSTNGYTSPE
jgi:hypothetical protein